MSQAINIRAVQWAIEQDGLSVTQKAILVTFALHADDRGYTFPSKERMRFIWGMDPTTIREGTEYLVTKSLLGLTKQKRGWTRQVNVFRLPKVSWESSGKSHAFKNEKGATKVRERCENGVEKSPTNNEELIKNKKHNHADGKTQGNSLPNGQSNVARSSVSLAGSYKDHIKWPEFAAHAERLNKPPDAEWFKKWLAKQRPEWRNRKSPQQEISEESGYLLDGKFLTKNDANELGRKNPDLLLKFRAATRRNGKII